MIAINHLQHCSIGKIFLPRVDIWTELLSKPRNHSTLWYYGPALCTYFLVLSLYLGHDQKEDELVIMKQLWSAGRESAMFMAYYCLCAALLFYGVRLWLIFRPLQQSS